MSLRPLLLSLALALWAPGAALADAAPFDLAGPSLEVTVTHQGVTLPIAEAPNLSPGDELQIKADLPAAQSAPYLLVAGFLRGATNPPPKTWFHRDETWTKSGREGLKIAVPQGAEQAIVFLAPRTGGDFDTLVGAVRGRPGAFVRASQDLNQASLDRSRLDAFLAALRKRDPDDPHRLQTVSPLLARSLSIKLNPGCLQKMPDLQAPCLMQGEDSLVLNDGHSSSLVQTLTSGATSDLAMQISATSHADFGYYSPYIAAVMDIARILDSFHTARYQYIPALPIDRGDRLDLRLNTPPSFHSPLSVLVTALPAVAPPRPPPLQLVDAKGLYCAERSDLVLPLEGAPLAYSTAYGRELALRLATRDGKAIDLPVKADAERGGFVVDTSGLDPAKLAPDLEGALRGDWGFASFEGPTFHLQSSHAAPWALAAADRQSLVVGRDDAVSLEGEDAACVESVSLDAGEGPAAVAWKADGPRRLAVTLPLAQAQPGKLTLLVKLYGLKSPDRVPLEAYAQAGRIDGFTLHAGDASGVLEGARLDEVAALEVGKLGFAPGALARNGAKDELTMIAADAAAASALKPGESRPAEVTLKDGRIVRLKVQIAPPRPSVALIDKSVSAPPQHGGLRIELSGTDQLPQSATLAFSVRAIRPDSFSGAETIQVAAADGANAVSLTEGHGLTLADAHVVVAQLSPATAFASSAFGPLRFRVIENGAASDWLPLATLVRLPRLGELSCGAGGCELKGADLFLIDSLSGDPGFDHPVKAPEGFTGASLPAPRPKDGRLYIRLHDDPAVVDAAIVPRRPASRHERRRETSARLAGKD